MNLIPKSFQFTHVIIIPAELSPNIKSITRLKWCIMAIGSDHSWLFFNPSNKSLIPAIKLIQSHYAINYSHLPSIPLKLSESDPLYYLVLSATLNTYAGYATGILSALVLISGLYRLFTH